MSGGPADSAEEISDFEAAVELIGELAGHVVAVGILAPPDAPRATAVVRGRLKASAVGPCDRSARGQARLLRAGRRAPVHGALGPPRHPREPGCLRVREAERRRRARDPSPRRLTPQPRRAGLPTRGTRRATRRCSHPTPLARSPRRPRARLEDAGWRSLGDRGPGGRADGAWVGPGGAARVGPRPLRALLGDADGPRCLGGGAPVRRRASDRVNGDGDGAHDPSQSTCTVDVND